MNRNVAVIGTGETVFRSHHPDKTYVDLAQEAVVAALRDANMEPAGQEGVIEAATIVSAQFENLPKPPYCIAYVRLDGVSTAMVNFVKEFDMSDLQAASVRVKPGARVKVKWIDKPEGKATDFYYVLA
jgi:uncharacterized OB-fold protein